MASTTASYPLVRERNAILGALLVLAAGAWALLLWQPRTSDGDMKIGRASCRERVYVLV